MRLRLYPVERALSSSDLLHFAITPNTNRLCLCPEHRRVTTRSTVLILTPLTIVNRPNELILPGLAYFSNVRTAKETVRAILTCRLLSHVTPWIISPL